MRRRWLAVVSVALVGGALAAACDTVECGTGTHELDGVCVANVPACECGPGMVVLMTDIGCECIPAPSICGASTTWDADAGACVPDGDAGVPSPRTAAGACWTRVGMLQPVNTTLVILPEDFCTMQEEALETLMGTAPGGGGGLVLVGGYGIPLAAGDAGVVARGLAYPFLLDGEPAGVPLVVDAERGFATDPGERVFTWESGFAPSAPRLRLRDVRVTGTLGDDDRPTSVGGAGGTGRLYGCFTPWNAAEIYIAVLSQTFLQFIESNGGTLSCDATGGGTHDGYLLELRWGAGQPVDVVY